MLSLHVYWASIFILPHYIVKKIESICREFLWGMKSYSRSVPLVSWEKLCVAKNEGGLNFKNCGLWNYATVGKRVWWVNQLWLVELCNMVSIWRGMTFGRTLFQLILVGIRRKFIAIRLSLLPVMWMVDGCKLLVVLWLCMVQWVAWLIVIVGIIANGNTGFDMHFVEKKKGRDYLG